MQLKFNRVTRKNIITLELETTNFSRREDLALTKFGEPIVKIEKSYEGKFPVKIEKRIKTSFKVRVRFDGNEGIEEAIRASNTFMEELKDELEIQMRVLMDKLDDYEVEVEGTPGLIDIKY